MAEKQMFEVLVMVELLDSEEEEENKGLGMTRSWLKKREELGYFKALKRWWGWTSNISTKFQTSLHQILRHKKS